MNKYFLFAVGSVLALFGVENGNQKQALDRTIDLAKKASHGKATIEIKPMEKMLLAPQDISGGAGGKSRYHRKTVV